VFSPQFSIQVLSLSRLFKRLIVCAVDIILCALTVYLAFCLRLGEWASITPALVNSVFISLFFAIPVFIFFGLYRAIFRYSGWPALITVVKASFVYAIFYCLLIMLSVIDGIPRTVGIIQPLLLLLFVGASRAYASFWLGNSYREQLKLGEVPRVFIYGAGSSGRQLASALRNSRQMHVIGFLDDDKELQGKVLNGIPIYKPGELSHKASAFNVSQVLLALPSVTRERRNKILSAISSSNLAVHTIPNLADLASGKIAVSDLKELDIEDLLDREPRIPDVNLMSKNIHRKSILVTGAGGSIGSELCRQMIDQRPDVLVLVEQNEFALYSIEQELRSMLDNIDGNPIKLRSALGSIRDIQLIHQIIDQYRPYAIFHAAAYKHVTLVESNPVEGLLNNTFGTLGLAKLAAKMGVPNFILISTDKAVRPTSVMGASKRLAEMILQAIAAESSYGKNTTFSMVRFGNVLNSSGSVVPLFRKQIKEGGPITLTNIDVTRYFMTIPEAAQLVLQASSMAEGGDVFVLDMGQPVKIIDLARRMILLSGLQVRDTGRPDGDIEIQVTGLRPGEKLYEELLIGKNSEPTYHPQILRAQEEFLQWSSLDPALRALSQNLGMLSIEDLKRELKKLVPAYRW
jgi:FlaA1/EpsC-like NDP-sugar epimerase